MSSRQQILDAICAMAKRLGRAPTLFEFVSSAGVTRHSILRFFPKWNDAIRAAKLRTSPLFVTFDDTELLKDWGQTVRNNRGMPSRRAYLLAGKYEPRTLEKRFGRWTGVPAAFRRFAKGKRQWADVLALLPSRLPSAAKAKDESQQPGQCSPSKIPLSNTRHAALKGRATYGNPIDFRGLRHEPLNEQGVVLLFGMLASELGYRIESVQNGFPDCEAIRQIGPDRWQRVRIEFEFESRNFRHHRHSFHGCDVIVCWRHNWQRCPDNIEVVELSSLIKSLTGREV